MDKIKITNFRIIKNTWDLELAPITFFTGTNNSGKSSVLKSLMLLDDYSKSENQFVLSFNGKNAKKHKIEAYYNAIHRDNHENLVYNQTFEFVNNGCKVNLAFEPMPSNNNTNEFIKGKLTSITITRIMDNADICITKLGGNEYQLKLNTRLLEPKQSDDIINEIAELNLFREKQKREIERLNQEFHSVNESEAPYGEMANLQTQINALKDELESLKKKSGYLKYREDLRLNSILRELNLSLDKAVLFLLKKGIEIEARPTTYLSKEAYDLLINEFGFGNKEKVLQNNLESLKRKLPQNINSEKISIQQRRETAVKSLKEIEKRIAVLESNNYDKNKENYYNPTFEITNIQYEGISIAEVIEKEMSIYFTENEAKLGKIDKNKEMINLIQLREYIKSVLTITADYLSPHRNSQTRLYVNEDTSSDIYELINYHAQHPMKNNSEGNKFIKKWMREFEIADDYKIRTVEGIASVIEFTENRHKINLVDKGFGAGQLFTILFKIGQSIDQVLINKSGENKSANKEMQLILIEEPEANLHPQFQSKLADLFLDALKYDLRFIIETHSEYIIRKTQLLGLENSFFSPEGAKLNPFKVYYFDKLTGPYEMAYETQGNFNRDFGEGFFDHSTKLTLERIKTVKNSNRNV